jgi:hypothetical protein
MKHLLAFAMLAPLWAPAQDPVSNRDRDIVIQAVNVIPMDRETVLTNQDVWVRNGRITKVEAAREKFKTPKGTLVVDGHDKYLMPGLAEMHAHVPPVDDLNPMKDVLMLYAANGITTIRGMLGHPRHLELRNMLERGEVIGPKLYTSGPSFNGNSVKSPEQGAEMVRQQKQLGYDFLKLHPGLSLASFDAIARTANEVGIPYAGHVSFYVGVWHAIESKYASIDHLDGFVEGMVPGIESLDAQKAGLFGMFVARRADTTQIPRLVKALKDNGIRVVPTQTLMERWYGPDMDADALGRDPEMIYEKKETVDMWVSNKKKFFGNPELDMDQARYFIQLRRKLIRECHKAGVKLVLGSDGPQVFNIPGFSLHHELEYMVKSGLTPYEALETGTVNAAEYFGRTDAGTIKPGNASDLVLLSANPLADIRNSLKIEGVMLGSNWLSREYLDQQLARLKKW